MTFRLTHIRHVETTAIKMTQSTSDKLMKLSGTSMIAERPLERDNTW